VILRATGHLRPPLPTGDLASDNSAAAKDASRDPDGSPAEGSLRDGPRRDGLLGG